MDTWRTQLQRALQIATTAHEGQRYGADPYKMHVVRVAFEVRKRFMGHKHQKAMEIVAVLHDVVEDTSVTLADLSEAGFDPLVIEGVDFCTDAPGASRAEKKRATYRRWREWRGEGFLGTGVKLCDRYDNARSASGPILTSYRQEHAAFRAAVEAVEDGVVLTSAPHMGLLRDIERVLGL